MILQRINDKLRIEYPEPVIDLEAIIKAIDAHLDSLHTEEYSAFEAANTVPVVEVSPINESNRFWNKIKESVVGNIDKSLGYVGSAAAKAYSALPDPVKLYAVKYGAPAALGGFIIGEAILTPACGPSPAVDNPPQIERYAAPGSAFVGENINMDFKVTDDNGVNLVKAYVAPQGQSLEEKSISQIDESLWRLSYTPSAEGDISYKIIATDSSGKTDSFEGSIISKKDNPPSLNNETTSSVFAGDKFRYAAEAVDDRGILEVYIERGSSKIPLQKNNGVWESAEQSLEAGTYPYKLVAVDSANQKTSLEGLIVSNAAIAQLPDLAFNSVTYAAGEWSGDKQNYVIDVNVANNGDKDTGSFYVSNGLEQKLVSSIEPGKTSLVQFNASLSEGQSTFNFTLDSTGAVNEKNESNNSYQLKIDVSAAPKPDLAFNSVTYAAGEWSGDKQNYVFNVNVANNGDKDTGSFYVSNGLEQILVSSIEPGKTSLVQFNASLSEGQNNFNFAIDSANAVNEKNESNNSYQLKIDVSAAPKPDLAFNNVTYAEGAWNGDKKEYTLSVDVANNGDKDTGSFYVSNGLEQKLVSNIEPGKTSLVQFNASLSEGQNTFDFALDSGNAVNEKNESNNSYQLKIDVSAHILGDIYKQQLTNSGYSSDIAQRVASLKYNDNNKSFADEIVLVGSNASYAKDKIASLALSIMEDNAISSSELVSVKDLDIDSIANATEITNGTNILDKFNKLPASLESLVVLNDELYVTIAGNDDLSYAFNLQNFKSMIKELEDAPYKDELIGNLGQLSVVLNAKVRFEDSTNQDTEVRFAIGNYIFNQYKNGNLLVSLDTDSLKQNYPDQEKRDLMLSHIWYVPEWRYTNDFNMITGKEAQLLNATTLQKVFDSIETAYNNPDSDAYKEARLWYNQWLGDRANNGWANTVEGFKDIDSILSSDTEFGKTWDKIKFIYGYARSPYGGYELGGYPRNEAFMINMLPWVFKAYGVPIAFGSADNPEGRISEFIIEGTPLDIINQIKTQLKDYEIIDFGSYGVSMFSPKALMVKDGTTEFTYYVSKTVSPPNQLW